MYDVVGHADRGRPFSLLIYKYTTHFIFGSPLHTMGDQSADERKLCHLWSPASRYSFKCNTFLLEISNGVLCPEDG